MEEGKGEKGDKKNEQDEDLAKTVEKMLKEMEEKFNTMSNDVTSK